MIGHTGLVTGVWDEGGGSARRRLWLDLAIAGVLALVTLAQLRTGQTTATAASALLTIAVAVRHLAMPVMVGLAVVAALAQMIFVDVALVADVAYAVCFFTLGAHRDPRVRRFGLGAAAAASIGAGVWGALVRAQGSASLSVGVAFIAVTAVVCLGGWAAGFIRHQNRAAIQARVDAQVDALQRRRMADAFEQEQERNRIAADMHDVVAHSWAVVAAQADGARYSLRTSPGDPAPVDQALGVIGETARSAIADLRTLLARLRYQETEGTTPGFEQQTQLIEQMRGSGMILDVHEQGQRSDSPLLALTAYRLLSESLTNALKHGDLTRAVTIRQDWTAGYDLTVTNTIGEPGDGTGHGIAGMAERASVAGGTLISHQAGDTWLVHAHLPDAQTPPGQERA